MQTQLIKKGSTNASAVKELKGLLNTRLGSTLDVANGNFGDSTEAVVKQFQRREGLIADGIVGKLTWDALYKCLSCGVVSSPFILDRVIAALTSQVGVKEATGRNDGVEVESYLKSVGLGKGYAWCQAFLFWGFDKVSKEMGRSNPMPRTAGVLDSWNRSKEFQVKKGERPQVGDVFVMDFGKGQGHTGMITDVQGDFINTVEGNTSADPTLPSEDREGQGVYRRRRSIKSINKGFLRYS